MNVQHFSIHDMFFWLCYKLQYASKIFWILFFLLSDFALCIYFLSFLTHISLATSNICYSLSAFKCWCQAVWQYSVDFPSHSPLDGGVMWDQFVVLLVFFPLFPISYFQVVLSEVNICVLVQVFFKFCFWAFIESMGSFTGSKGLHFYFFGSFAGILSLYALFEPSLCNYNYTLVLVMFPFVFVTISYLDKFFLPASKLVWCQIILTLLYVFWMDHLSLLNVESCIHIW